VYRPEKSLHFFINNPDTDLQNCAIRGSRVIQKQEDLTRNARNTGNETEYRPEKSLHFFVNNPDTDLQTVLSLVAVLFKSRKI
jgi:hypothetical protein